MINKIVLLKKGIFCLTLGVFIYTISQPAFVAGLPIEIITPAPLALYAAGGCPNGGFESGNFNCWAASGPVRKTVQSNIVFEGNYAALLGDPDFSKCRGGLPKGEARLQQIFQVPNSGDPFLSFSYRILSYDELKGDRFDHFDVYIDDLSDPAPPFRILRDGSTNGLPPSGNVDGCSFPIDDTGWKSPLWHLDSVTNFDNQTQSYDLRGKTIALTFINFSNEPTLSTAWYNT